MANLFESLIGMFEDVVQYNKDNREFEGIVSNVTIDTLCNYMTSDSGRLDGQHLINEHLPVCYSDLISNVEYIEYLNNSP